MQWWQNFLGLAVAGLTGGLAGWGTQWLRRRTERETNTLTKELQTRSLDQQLITHLQNQIDKQDERSSKQDERMSRLVARVDELESLLDREERGRAAAVRYIRRLLDWIAERMPNHQPPEIPLILREDLT